MKNTERIKESVNRIVNSQGIEGGEDLIFRVLSTPKFIEIRTMYLEEYYSRFPFLKKRNK